MKNLFTLLMMATLLAFSSCSYDDDDLWNKVNDLDKRIKTLEQVVKQINNDISSLETIVNALENSKSITNVSESSKGWTITFSDDTSIEIEHGKNGNDGANGADAPIIGISKDGDAYYWTISTNPENDPWLRDADGNKIPVSGKDGSKPVMGVDKDGFWTVDYSDGKGPKQILDSNGDPIKATAKSETSLIVDVISSQTNVTFILADGTIFNVPKIIPVIVEIEANEEENFKYAQTRTFNVKMKGVTGYQVTGPTGWNVVLKKTGDEVGILSVTAPNEMAINLGVSIAEGTINILGIGNGAVNIPLKVAARAYELRILSFEDGDYKGAEASPYWTSLIDSPQYGGSLLYPTGQTLYGWYDKSNTELASEFVNEWGDFQFWSGGEAISNYVETNIDDGDYLHQLSVYYHDPVTGYGGNKGSKNFCVHYGYVDNSGYGGTERQNIYFADGEARVVDHMYVTITTYLLNCVQNGNGLTDPVGPNGFIRIVATGFDENGNEITNVTPKFEIANYDRTVIDWQKWDLSGLGKVTKIEFNVEGDSDNGYGFSQPAYFAYDDVAVRF